MASWITSQSSGLAIREVIFKNDRAKTIYPHELLYRLSTNILFSIFPKKENILCSGFVIFSVALYYTCLKYIAYIL